MTSTPHAIERVLVANRGEIAVRIIEAARARGLGTVAVYATADRTSPHVAAADVAVHLGDGAAATTYLDVDRLLDAARVTGADCVHPGYGFVSERADAAAAVIAAGLTWIGPHPEAIATMGDKLAAKELAIRLGLPVLAGTELEGDEPFAWRAQAAGVGYPLLVKAAAGGGGRGMRAVADDEALAEAVQAARREAAASFGDGRVFAERLLARPHHIEVQVAADRYGHMIHLGERDCSVQRRHQKLVEEAPSPAIDAATRATLTDAAVRLAEAIGYDSVGTVEFLVDAADGTVAFLEMNTRLQVEHPVTEETTGIDLVDLQFALACGHPLPVAQHDVAVRGHAVEVRLVAEDPAAGWLPATGTVVRPALPRGVGVRCDHAVADGLEVGTAFDSLLAKVVAHGRDRDEALARLRAALHRTRIPGVRTNRDQLLAVLADPTFRAGRATTGLLEERPELAAAGPPADDVDRAVTVATVLAARTRRDTDPHWSAAPAGWRVSGHAAPQSARWEVTAATGDREVPVRYRPTGTGAWDVEVGSVTHPVRVLRSAVDATGGDALVEVDGLAETWVATIVGDAWWMAGPTHQVVLRTLPRLVGAAHTGAVGGPTAPVPGRIVSVAVAVGDTVTAGQPLVVLEAMKVEHTVAAPSAATVAAVLVAPGDNVDAHQLLVRLEEA